MRAFFYLIGIQLRRVLQHRADALVWMLVSILRLLVGLGIIFTVYSFIPEIEGFDRYTCILLFAAYSMVSSVFYMLFAWTLWYSRRYLVEGKLMLILTKPLSPLLYLMGENFSREEVPDVIASTVLFFVASIILKAHPLQIFTMLAFLVPGVLTIAGLYLIVASIASRFHTVEQAFSPITEFMSFAEYPISIYPKAIQFVLLWVVPYSLIAFIPIAAVRGISVDTIPFNMWWLPLYGVVVFVIGFGAFRRSITKFEATGS